MIFANVIYLIVNLCANGSCNLLIFSDAPACDGGSKIINYNVQMKGTVEEGAVFKILHIIAFD
jgi:hypothetical protein